MALSRSRQPLEESLEECVMALAWSLSLFLCRLQKRMAAVSASIADVERQVLACMRLCFAFADAHARM